MPAHDTRPIPRDRRRPCRRLEQPSRAPSSPNRLVRCGRTQRRTRSQSPRALLRHSRSLLKLASSGPQASAPKPSGPKPSGPKPSGWQPLPRVRPRSRSLRPPMLVVASLPGRQRAPTRTLDPMGHLRTTLGRWCRRTWCGQALGRLRRRSLVPRDRAARPWPCRRRRRTPPQRCPAPWPLPRAHGTREPAIALGTADGRAGSSIASDLQAVGRAPTAEAAGQTTVASTGASGAVWAATSVELGSFVVDGDVIGPPVEPSAVPAMVDGLARAGGAHRVVVVLSPPELGRLRIVVSEAPGGTAVQLQVERPATQALIEHALGGYADTSGSGSRGGPAARRGRGAAVSGRGVGDDEGDLGSRSSRRSSRYVDLAGRREKESR